MKAFNVYVLPVLEYCSCVRNIRDRYLVDIIEHVLHYFTERLEGFYSLSYTEWLDPLGILTLEKGK